MGGTAQVLQDVPPRTDADRAWGVALTGAIGSGKTTTARLLAGLMGWRMVSSGDVARSIDADTAATGAMANPRALDEALLPMLEPGPVILDGYPRTRDQLTVLPMAIDVVWLEISEEAAARRVAARAKHGWDEAKRLRDQRDGLAWVRRYAAIEVPVGGLTPGEIVFTILQSDYLSPPAFAR